MDKDKKIRRLLLAASLLTAGAILGVFHLLADVITIGDFGKGFFDGMGITLSVFGIIFFVSVFVKTKDKQ